MKAFPVFSENSGLSRTVERNTAGLEDTMEMKYTEVPEATLATLMFASWVLTLLAAVVNALV